MLIVTLLFIDILQFNTVANYRRWKSSIYGTHIEDRNRFFKVSTSDNCCELTVASNYDALVKSLGTGKVSLLLDFVLLIKVCYGYLNSVKRRQSHFWPCHRNKDLLLSPQQKVFGKNTICLRQQVSLTPPFRSKEKSLVCLNQPRPWWPS
jgi:hypothetical protein